MSKQAGYIILENNFWLNISKKKDFNKFDKVILRYF